MAGRVQVIPAEAAPGATVQVRIVIGHPNENGMRRSSSTGERIRRNLIRDLVCRYDGQIVFRASLGTGIAANPYLQFSLRAVKSADIVFDWEDEAGARDSAKTTLTVKG
jgi:sulfur-oxidizing protein SoxZ